MTGDAARRELVASLDALLEPGLGYEFILLRETPLDERCVDCGDVDLLGTRRSVHAFLSRLSEVCVERGQSFQVRRTKMEKTQVSLLSANLRHQIVFDLWSELWQVFRGRRCLRFRDLHRLCERRGSCLLRLPPDVEWAIYAQHLAFKRKDLSSADVQERLHFYAGALEQEGRRDLAESATGIARMKLLGKPELALLESTLSMELPSSYFATARTRRWSRSLRSRVARRVRDRRLRGVVAVVGVDGVGKTTIGAALGSTGAVDERRQYVVGKSLFRESWVFTKLYAWNRRLPKARRLRRERIDDLLAPLAFLVAAIRVRRSLRLGGMVLVDRYLPDFLYVRRKTDRPRVSLLAGLLKPLCPPVRVVHLSVPHSVLQGRKTEITAAGMRRYEERMRAFYTTRRWVDYLRFDNRAAADDAIVALESYLFATRPQARAGAVVRSSPVLGSCRDEHRPERVESKVAHTEAVAP
jgi:thymidylate kinase